jgi:hypothetical protein
MKRFLFLVLVVVAVVFFPLQSAHAQLTVIDTALATIMENTKIAQGIHYAQMVVDNATQITNTVKMIENTYRQVQLATQNLIAAKDIQSWSDLQDWYNRQLFLEQMASKSFNNIQVKIGKENYSITDIEGMKDGMTDSYRDYWAREFTEEQNREMWLGLGLTPANYAYVQPFRQTANDISKILFTNYEMTNEDYMKAAKRLGEIQDQIASDFLLSDDKQMGDKQIQMYQLEILLLTNKAINDMMMNQALQMKKEAAEHYMSQKPYDATLMSFWDQDDGFRKLE